MKVRAAVLYEAGQAMQIESLDLAAPKAGEVLVGVSPMGSSPN